MTIEANDRQVAGNAESIPEIQVKSEIGGVAALDNVARFSLLSVVSGQLQRGDAESRASLTAASRLGPKALLGHPRG